MKKLLLTTTILSLSITTFAQTYWTGSSTVTTTTTGNANVNGTLTAGVIVSNAGIVGTGLNLGSTGAINLSTTLGPGYKIYSENTNNLNNGFANFVTNTVTGTQYGFRNDLTFSGTSGVKYGFYNTLSSTSASPNYGIYNTLAGTNNSTRYGIYNKVTSTGTGTKYGIYTQVTNPGTSELRFGIYSDALGTGAKAGYFLGDVETKGKMMITGNTQGRFVIASSTATTGTIGEQELTITPNTTAGQDDWNSNNALTFFNNGLLQKSTVSASQKVLTVHRPDLTQDVFRVYGNGVVWATEVNVALTSGFPDYVFESSYDLMPLSDVRAYIQTNGHLPNVPTAATVAADGINVGEMTKTLVEKVEELTLYLLQQDEKLKQQQAEIDALKLQLAAPKQ
ncbi:MAG TPA: hypothetical protein VK151_09260 [Fluviicola sp.]|nr:hypothetical protein [Fluviicola sp.]